MQSTHDLNVEGLQRVAGGLDEIDTGVDTVINNVCAVNLVLRLQVGIVSLLDVFDDRAPRVIVVDKITEARSVDHSQAKTHAIFLDICTDGLDRYCLGDDVVTRAGTLLGRVEGGVEQSVDESRLSKTRFTYHMESGRDGRLFIGIGFASEHHSDETYQQPLR